MSGPKSNGTYPYKKPHKGKEHRTPHDDGEMFLQAEESQGLLANCHKLEEGPGAFSLQSLKGTHLLTSFFQTSGLQRE